MARLSQFEIRQTITNELTNLGNEFTTNALAYLSLTSKNEQLLCAALAKRLADAFSSQDHMVVGRETYIPGKRIDVAVLSDGEPIALVEAKSAHVFDLVLSPDQYPSKGMKKDAERLRSIEFDCERLVLVFFTHAYDEPSRSLNKVIKYLRGIRAFTGKVNRGEIDAKVEINKAIQRFDETMGDFDLVAAGQINAGTAFNVNVSVLYRMYSVSVTQT